MTLVGNLVNRSRDGRFSVPVGNYFMLVAQASSTVDGVQVIQTWGMEDWKTPNAYIPN